MSRLPDFSSIGFEPTSAATGSASGQSWTTPEGIDVKQAYGPADVAGLDFLNTWPGAAPFLRGPYPTMYVTQPWTVRQYAGFSTAEDSNAFYRRNLAAGQKGLSVAFDLATHRGYDSDHPRVPAMSAWPVSPSIPSTTCARCSIGIPLDQMSVSMTMNGAVLPILALYIVAAEEQGVSPEKADRHHSERHSERVHGPQHLHLSAAASMRIISDIFAFTSQNMPKFNSISISGYHMQEAGATADLELGLHAGRRHRVCPRRRGRRPANRQVCTAAVVLLGHRHELLHGSRQDARRAHALGQADQGV
jgi:methylmalonyl-CoA mutase